MGGQDLVAKLNVATYSKILLHGAKHPTSPVIGLLMGTRSGSEINVVAVLPVLHGSPVGPLLDVAVSIAPSIFPDTVIVGIYFSNDRSDSDLAPVYIARIVKSLHDKGFAVPCLVVQLKNSLIENMDSFCINGTQDGQSVTIDVNNNMTPSKVNAAIQSSTLLSQHTIRKFTDFEDHSNEIEPSQTEEKDGGNDFRNVFVDSVV